MRPNRMTRRCIALAAFFSSICAGGESQIQKVSDIRQSYVGHTVSVNTQAGGCWHHVAKIVAMRTADDAEKLGRNALGEPISATLADPQVFVDLACEDGTHGTANLYLSLIPIAFHLIPDGATSTKMLSDAQAALSKLVGTSIYPRAAKNYYSVTSSLADLEAQSDLSRYVRAEAMEPLKVDAVKAWQTVQGTFFLLKLTSSVSPKSMFASFHLEQGTQVNLTVSKDFYLNRPSCWVSGEERGSVDVGLSTKAVECQWGSATKINSYGRGDEQWVYENEDGSTDFVYLKNGIVNNVQHIAP